MNSIQNSFMKPHRSANFLLANSSFVEPKATAPVTESNQVSSINEKKIGEVWSKHNFDTNKVKIENLMILGNVKTTWGASSGEDDVDKGEERAFRENIDRVEEDLPQPKESKSTEDPEEDPPQNLDQTQEETSPSHHARRPPNAFLIFCKKHRPIVRERYPTTENRGVTKILGEWWALLNVGEKQPYNDLAKEYKDAFLSANPGFRWYKLPAPPLRMLATRPTTISKPPPATISSPPPTYLSEFTPGKLADESQLGGLTSLMNNNYSPTKKMDEDPPCWKVEDNNNENPNIYKDAKVEDKIQEMFSSPTNTTKPSLPPKPIKKRFFEQYEDEKNCSQNIFEEKNGITQQDLLNKVVDGIFANDKDVLEPKEQRKSDRMCKGKLYERFMVEGKLLGNKRDTKLTQHHRFSRIDSKIEHELTMTKPPYDSPKFNLENTIKRLAERTNVKIDYDEEMKPKVERVRSTSETSESNATIAKNPQVNFNLDLRINNLHSLSYDDFVRRKRESKKRKLKNKSEYSHSKVQRLENNNVTSKPDVPPVVGSKKRKNKLSITHLNKSEEDCTKLNLPQVFNVEEGKEDKNQNVASPLDKSGDDAKLPNDNALLGLATLAMVAASTKKIGENTGT